MAGSIAIVIGNEGNGVAEDLIAKSDAKITIPCPGPVESLNAAMAATVLLYEAARQRAAASGSPAKVRGALR
jgi:RNA methyltransferase, TrmH family